MIFLKFLGKILKVLRDGPSPAQVAGGFVLGMFLGLMPFFNLYSLLIILVIFILNVNISAAVLGIMVFKLFAYLLDPVFHEIGYALLVKAGLLHNFWTSLYNLPVFPLTKFNNTVVLGSFVSAIVFTIPVYFLSRTGVVQYRGKLEPAVKNMKIVKIVQGSKIYDIYSRVKNLGG
ncbi:TIGR03546 family protein [candidate division KSB1 bacterium]